MSENKIKLSCSIGIFIHNEADNISTLLEALQKQKLKRVGIAEIIVVSSASTDGSDDIVKLFSAEDKKIKLIIEEERKGKAHAINKFLEVAKESIVIISSGDIIPAENTIERMINPFDDYSIGMTGSHPVPANRHDSFCGYLVNLQWRLHHRISLKCPKLGEMIAFRKVITEIPSDSAVDEASIEAAITSKGLKLLYVSDAIVFNKGPESVGDFIKQRRRIAAGHLWLKKNASYKVSTNKTTYLLSELKSEVVESPSNIISLILAIALESWCRFLGWYDLSIKKKNPYKWDIVESTKKIDKISDDYHNKN